MLPYRIQLLGGYSVAAGLDGTGSGTSGPAERDDLGPFSELEAQHGDLRT